MEEIHKIEAEAKVAFNNIISKVETNGKIILHDVVRELLKDGEALLAQVGPKVLETVEKEGLSVAKGILEGNAAPAILKLGFDIEQIVIAQVTEELKKDIQNLFNSKISTQDK